MPGQAYAIQEDVSSLWNRLCRAGGWISCKKYQPVTSSDLNVTLLRAGLPDFPIQNGLSSSFLQVILLKCLKSTSDSVILLFIVFIY